MFRALVVACAVAVTACSDDEAPSPTDVTLDRAGSTDPAAVADANLPDPAEHASNAVVPEEPGFVQVDANVATAAELMDTFAANDIEVDDSVAAAVIENRPYANGDLTGATFDDLRTALADDGVDEFTVEAVIASLAA
jgi:hypothetical protein